MPWFSTSEDERLQIVGQLTGAFKSTSLSMYPSRGFKRNMDISKIRQPKKSWTCPISILSCKKQGTIFLNFYLIKEELHCWLPLEWRRPRLHCSLGGRDLSSRPKSRRRWWRTRENEFLFFNRKIIELNGYFSRSVRLCTRMVMFQYVQI